MRPSNSCCCCAPKCCSLRAGVLAIAILELIFGVFTLIVALVNIAAAAAATALDPGSGGWIAVYWISPLSLLVTGVTYTVAASFGIKATSSYPKVLACDPATVRASHVYFKMSQVMFILTVLLHVLMLVTYTIGYYRQVVNIIWMWVVYAAANALSAYYLYVIWSYKKLLENAAGGDSAALGMIVRVPPGQLPVGAAQHKA